LITLLVKAHQYCLTFHFIENSLEAIIWDHDLQVLETECNENSSRFEKMHKRISKTIFEISLKLSFVKFCAWDNKTVGFISLVSLLPGGKSWILREQDTFVGSLAVALLIEPLKFVHRLLLLNSGFVSKTLSILKKKIIILLDYKIYLNE